jgi:hypothetical protein
MKTVDFARRLRAVIRSEADELLVGPKTPLLPPLLPKALDHLGDAAKIGANLSTRIDDPVEHDERVRAMHAHALTACKYLDAYRESVIPPAVPGDPEGETDPSPTAERARASAAVILAGFGKTPRRRRH